MCTTPAIPKSEEIDFKTIIGFATAFLIFIGATRLLVENQEFGLPILKYISFSNIINYVLDVVYGLNRLIIIVLVLLLFRKEIFSIINFCFTKKYLRWVVGFVLLVVFIGIWQKLHTLYYSFAHERNTTNTIQFLLFFGLAIPAVVLNHFKTLYLKDKYILALLMIFSFTWCYTKAVSRIEMQNLNLLVKKRYSKIVFKDHASEEFKSSDSCFLITNTPEFVFTYNKNQSVYTAYPISEIFSITDNGSIDSLK
jgi:hypothetical protein